MNKENLPVVRKTSIINKIKNMLKILIGKSEDEQKFTNNTLPIFEKPNTIKMMEIIQSEMKLRNTLINNKSLFGSAIKGVNEKDVENILEWVVYNAREALFDNATNTDGYLRDLQGNCGIGQAMTAMPLNRMGLKTNINQMSNVIDTPTRHALITVSFPIAENEGGDVTEVPYLIDVTFRQFFKARGPSINGKPIKDKDFGIVTPNEGYFLCKMKNGTEFANELLSKGFVKLTPENAKLYCDAFTNAGKELKTYNRPPSYDELQTGISGQEYITRLYDSSRQDDTLDYDEEEFIRWGYNLTTPVEFELKKTKEQEAKFDKEDSRIDNVKDKNDFII